METIKIPVHLQRLVKKTLQHYFESDLEFQIVVRQTRIMQGRCKKYVFQMSNGTQQIKRYEPAKYKNKRESPLRNRTRTIMQLASENGMPSSVEKLQELFRTYPYCLLKSEPVNLRMRNFYFDTKGVREGDLIEVYRIAENGTLIKKDEGVEYSPKKSIRFEYQGRDEEAYCALNNRSGEMFYLPLVIWQ